jgi:hypothetical protein
MALTLVNPNLPSPMVTRGKPANLGTLAAANAAVQFGVSQVGTPPNGTDALAIFTTGNLTATAFLLEGSGDGGLTWFTITPSAATAGQNNSTAIISATGTSDTAVSFAACYNITGLSGWCLFRFGITGTVTGTGAAWVALS